MSGSTASLIVIPPAAFLLLIIWLVMVYHADSHPFWRGRQPPSRHPLTTSLPTQALAGSQRPARTQPGTPATAQPAPTVPGQRRPAATDRPAAAAGATATAARPSTPDHPSAE
jgi:hypothetical protein